MTHKPTLGKSHTGWHESVKALYLAGYALWKEVPDSPIREAYRLAAVSYDHALDALIEEEREDDDAS